ncbi:hypothetical protein [Salmonella phage PHA46]
MISHYILLLINGGRCFPLCKPLYAFQKVMQVLQY